MTTDANDRIIHLRSLYDSGDTEEPWTGTIGQLISEYHQYEIAAFDGAVRDALERGLIDKERYESDDSEIEYAELQRFDAILPDMLTDPTALQGFTNTKRPIVTSMTKDEYRDHLTKLALAMAQEAQEVLASGDAGAISEMVDIATRNGDDIADKDERQWRGWKYSREFLQAGRRHGWSDKEIMGMPRVALALMDGDLTVAIHSPWDRLDEWTTAAHVALVDHEGRPVLDQSPEPPADPMGIGPRSHPAAR